MIEPRVNNSHKVPSTKKKTSNLTEIENEFLEQSHKLRLLGHVESSGLMEGEVKNDTSDLEVFDYSFAPT